MKPYFTATIEILKLAEEDLLTLSLGTGDAEDEEEFDASELG